MTYSVPSITLFTIEFRGKTHNCARITRNNSILYRVAFPDAHLYLTIAVTANGTAFWTSVPEDLKRRHIVQELGEIMEIACPIPGGSVSRQQADFPIIE